MMTKAQSDVLLVQMQASFEKVQDGVEWFKAPQMWVMRRTDARTGLVELRQHPCAC